MRKFAYKKRTDKEQTDVSKTESTLILSGSSLDTRGSWPTEDKDHHDRKGEQQVREGPQQHCQEDAQHKML